MEAMKKTLYITPETCVMPAETSWCICASADNEGFSDIDGGGFDS